jgi:hypothetical protein
MMQHSQVNSGDIHTKVIEAVIKVKEEKKSERDEFLKDI